MPAIVIMGVSGCGKSTLAVALAAALRWHFVEGDSLHPPTNLAKMAAGHALNDADRLPFLHQVGHAIALHTSSGVVIACSALKSSYRDLLRTYSADLVFVLPVLSRAAQITRLQNRSDHFMPLSLLDSQLVTLEIPGPHERALLVSAEETTEAAVARVLAWLRSQHFIAQQSV
jgi:gluconokinase